MAHLLGGESLRLEYPTTLVFESVTVGLSEGDRIGVVGRNGDGKSSLLRMLAGRLEPDAGRVTVRGGVRLGVLEQGDVLDPALTVGAAVVGDRPEHEWAGDAKVRDVLAGLVADLPWDGPVGNLSGGERRRVALAALLAGDHDVLFLDEPTNHLDVQAITWLAGHLKTRWAPNAGGLLVVTHDRWFLDEICTATWEVHDGVVEPFEGGYAAYVLQRVERDRMAAATEARRQNLMRKELAWLRRGAPARTSKPKFRIDAANALIADVPPLRNPTELARMATARLGKDVIDIVDVSVTYAGPDTAAARPVLRDVTWLIGPGERTGILGTNGAGKSTLLGLVTGEVAPTSGRVKRGTTVKVAALTQDLAELADVAEERVSDVVARYRTTYATGAGSSSRDLTPGQLLERLGFTNAQLATPVRDLSGGQRRRLQLLLTLLDEPNVLVLDEPTNDMDTDMLAAIEDLLDTWPGTLLVVSHDRYLLERVTDQQYAVLDGHLRHVPGGVDEYLRLLARRDAAGTTRGAGASPSSTGAAPDGAPRAGAIGGGPSAAEQRAARKELGAVERRLSRLTSDAAKLETAMAEHDPTDHVGLVELHGRLDALTAEIADLEDRWLALADAAD